ncbi:unnamed protein product [Brachionus calyciflorus]|uniref:GTP:AMP phosphotransferase, mitochondrial n=1 Tax=Brachionus calyciflorus TaxID=104777 RepID=A0A813WDP5_9BILA|nr:unnamed protein product [Brachionus calyciflorus]
MASKLRLFILGAPGSGKGTISSRIVKEFRLSHLSSGDLLRSNIQQKSDLGLKVKDFVSKGQLVPDDLVTRVVLQELQKLSKSSWLLDGFPRNLSQCKVLESQRVQVDRVINLNVPFEEIVNRLKHRWIHPPSGRVYNLEFNPPKVPGKDDVTGEPLIQRPDDSEDVVTKRLKIYEEQTKPIIEFYASKNLVETFTGNTSDYLWPLIKNSLHTLRNDKENEALALREHRHALASNEAVTHTGQRYAPDDYRRIRFETGKKLVNPNFAINLLKEDPVVVCDKRTVWSSGGGPLGHPKIYINLSNNEIHDCQYSGRKFILRKYYDPAKHGKSINYEDYKAEMEQLEYGTDAA